jgi:hypothetical protein
MSDDELGAALILREWDEAWTQSRHLETMRGQYLGFFFAATLGVSAVTAKQLADDSLGSPGSLMTLAALAVGLQVLAAFLYVAVVRINRVLNYYQRLIYTIKKEIHARPGAPVDLRAYERWPQPERKGWAGRLSTTQGTAELVLAFATSAFPLILIACLVRAATLPDISITTLVVCAVSLIAAVAAGAGSIWAAAGIGALSADTALPPDSTPTAA